MKDIAVVDWTIPDPKLSILLAVNWHAKKPFFIRWNKISLWRMRQQSQVMVQTNYD